VEITGFEASKKLNIIKELKNMLNLSLKDAKDMVDKVPSVIYKDKPQEEATKLADTLKGLGCVVQVV
jgi:large subunit ribosomal protein L7/L12